MVSQPALTHVELVVFLVVDDLDEFHDIGVVQILHDFYFAEDVVVGALDDHSALGFDEFALLFEHVLADDLAGLVEVREGDSYEVLSSVIAAAELDLCEGAVAEHLEEGVLVDGFEALVVVALDDCGGALGLVAFGLGRCCRLCFLFLYH